MPRYPLRPVEPAVDRRRPHLVDRRRPHLQVWAAANQSPDPMTNDSPSAAPLPLGAPVDPAPARRPDDRTTLAGRIVTLRPLDPGLDAAPLWEATCGSGKDHLWAYLFEGPFEDRATFDAHLEGKAASADPFYLAIVDRRSGLAAGHAAYLRI